MQILFRTTIVVIASTDGVGSHSGDDLSCQVPETIPSQTTNGTCHASAVGNLGKLVGLERARREATPRLTVAPRTAAQLNTGDVR